MDDPALAIGTPDPGIGIQLTDVGFTHEESDLASLHGVDLALPVGTITALVGPTGSGKSTLADLVVGLVPASSGRVALAPGARSIVFQEAFLISGTVRDNVVFGNDAPDDAVWSALHLAAGDEFVRALPSGLDTVVGERGVSLSGGQRQRIALARALVRRPSILVLDDTTSALDPATEELILERLRTSLESTVLMIASRPSTIALADDVVYMEAGRVAAHGTHAELLALVPGYRDIVEAFEVDRAGAP